MSLRHMAAAWEASLPDSDKIVLLALADHAGADTDQCWPSIATLARKCSKAVRTIYAALARLEAAGHISRETRPGRGVVYTVHPCSGRTPTPAADAGAPLQPPHPTPAAAAPKPEENHHGNPSCSDEHETGARASDDAGSEAMFERWWAAWPTSWRRDPDGARAAWAERWADLPAEAALMASLAAYVADTRANDRQPCNPGTWLRRRRWLDGAGPAAGGGGLSAFAWTGPAEIRAALVAARGEGPARSYLDPAGWAGGRIRARTGLAAAWLREALAGTPFAGLVDPPDRAMAVAATVDVSGSGG